MVRVRKPIGQGIGAYGILQGLPPQKEPDQTSARIISPFPTREDVTEPTTPDAEYIISPMYLSSIQLLPNLPSEPSSSA